ncbi:MAG: M14 family metallocarboxypeptidase [Candidatus Poribacteria bacterium]|nr:M14 family metallocarboxypeptidase [Candidatus Poribacteria bacterium]
MDNQDYTRFTKRLKSLASPQIRIEISGVVNDYPVYRVLLHQGTGERKNILISAGVHGDEPAGPEVALRFLERDNTDLLEHFAFLILPCVNPCGYVHNTRENGHGIDINRSFESADVDVAEVNIVKQAIQGQRFDFFIDFHEDWEAVGFYLYEGQRDSRWMGPRIIRSVESIGQIDSESGENELPLADGVFQIDPAWGDAGMAPYIYHLHADHVMICETPTRWHLEQRITAHLTALDTALAIIQSTA